MTQQPDSGITVGAILRGAPDFTNNYPSGGEVLGPAWAHMWATLAGPDRIWRDGRELAEAAAEAVGKVLGRSVSVETCAHILRRAHRTQVPILELEYRLIPGARGPRNRAFYRLSEDARTRYLGA